MNYTIIKHNVDNDLPILKHLADNLHNKSNKASLINLSSESKINDLPFH